MMLNGSWHHLLLQMPHWNMVTTLGKRADLEFNLRTQLLLSHHSRPQHYSRFKFIFTLFTNMRWFLKKWHKVAKCDGRKYYKLHLHSDFIFIQKHIWNAIGYWELPACFRAHKLSSNNLHLQKKLPDFSDSDSLNSITANHSYEPMKPGYIQRTPCDFMNPQLQCYWMNSWKPPRQH